MADLRALKRWPGWLLMLGVVVAFLAIGAQRASSPRTADERALAISKRIACPVCDGESVAESQASASMEIKDRIDTLVGDGQMTDDQIVRAIDDSYPEELALEPGRSGIEALAWVLPPLVAVAGAGGVMAAFGRWRSRGVQTADDADRALVERALAASPPDASDAVVDAVDGET